MARASTHFFIAMNTTKESAQERAQVMVNAWASLQMVADGCTEAMQELTRINGREYTNEDTRLHCAIIEAQDIIAYIVGVYVSEFQMRLE